MRDKCQWLESIKHFGESASGTYREYTILNPECDKDRYMFSLSGFKYCPYCSKEIEKVNQ